MAKKGLFQKLGLVESVNSTEYNEELIKSLNLEMEEISGLSVEVPEDLDLSDVLTIEHIYSKFDLMDNTKSIFKVDEFSAVLPKELSTDARRASVLGILTASGLDVETLVNDANDRNSALVNTKDVFTTETVNMIKDCSERIAELEKEIDELKDVINGRKKAQETQDEIINAEIEKIEKIVKFINPTN